MLGLLLDTSILIASERSGGSVEAIVRRIRNAHGEARVGVSAISVVELTHGMYRAQNDTIRSRRRIFAEGIFMDMQVHPVTLEIGQLAGQIEGEQAAEGNVIALADLLIGATALHLGYAVATLNKRHFERIPGLHVVTL